VGCALAFVVYAGFTKSWNYWLATPCFLLLFYAIVFDLDKRFWLRDGGAVVVALAAAGLVWGLVSPGEWGLLRRGLASGATGVGWKNKLRALCVASSHLLSYWTATARLAALLSCSRKDRGHGRGRHPLILLRGAADPAVGEASH
jgi:hypothetical protein